MTLEEFVRCTYQIVEVKDIPGAVLEPEGAPR